MSSYYWLVLKDLNNRILYNESLESGVVLRPRYAGMRCPSCRKLDEIAAITLNGVDPDVRIRAKSDYLSTADEFICLSKRAYEIVIDHEICGWTFVPLPGIAVTSYHFQNMDWPQTCRRWEWNSMANVPNVPDIEKHVVFPVWHLWSFQSHQT
ncbi:hypothetical protein HRbin36_01471 [bacterium HR36]|nr:hypothetical protein HRbin36_01471 [bacterium HR36]